MTDISYYVKTNFALPGIGAQTILDLGKDSPYSTEAISTVQTPASRVEAFRFSGVPQPRARKPGIAKQTPQAKSALCTACSYRRNRTIASLVFVLIKLRCEHQRKPILRDFRFPPDRGASLAQRVEYVAGYSRQE